ncbi:MAG: YfhO family protein [Anaerolineales bacterium]|nr:YfhO family protein [Anaerolineales bacterium]
MTHTWLSRHWPYLICGVAPALLFAPFLLGAQMFYWGTPLLQFYPWRFVALEAVRAGHLPLWNPWLGNGAPLLANYQSALLYPPNWLALLLPLDLSLNWLLVLHLVWTGAGMVTLARSLGYAPLGQAVAGLAFGMGQYAVARAGFYSINAALAWLPWVLWSADALLKPQSPISNLQSRTGHALILSLCLALQLLAGHAQTTWYTWLLLAAWSLWRSLTLRPRPSLTSYFLLSTSFLLALLISSAQLLPTFEYLRQSPRADAAEYEFVMTYSFSPWRLLTLLAPDLLGNPARGRFYGYGNYLEDAVYVGVIPLLLGIGTIISFFSRANSQSAIHNQKSPIPTFYFLLFLTLLLPITLLLALGRNTPVFPWLYANVPTFDMFQAPTRMMVWFVFALALLGGWGADRWAAPAGRALYWTRLGTAGAVSIVLTALAALFLVPPATALNRQLLTVAQAVLVMGVNLTVFGALSLLKGRLPESRWALLVTLALAGDLLYANAGLNPGAPADLYRAPTPTGAALAQALDGRRLFQFPEDRQRVMFDPYFSFFSYGDPAQMATGARAVQLPNVALLEGIASANNFDPLVSARYKAFTDVVSATQSVKLLNLMNVGVVASSTPLPWEVIVRADAVTFYRVPGESRRVWLIPAGDVREVAGVEAALAALADPAFDPARTLLLEADDPGLLPDVPERSPISQTDPNAFSVSLQLTQDNWLLLADTWYPGWAAYLDGEPVPLRRGNVAFRAVFVPAGAHTVEFRYAPQTFTLGLRLSLAGIAVWLGLFLWQRRRNLN